MLASIILGLIGLIFVILGLLVWKKEKISLFHDYHYNHVSEENKKAFCTISGIGVLLIGVGLIISAVIVAITNSMWSFIPFAIGFVWGLVFLIYAGCKYNH